MAKTKKPHAFLVLLILFGLMLAILVPSSYHILAEGGESGDGVGESEVSLNEIQRQLEEKKKKISDLKNQITKYEQSIRTRQKEVASLGNQIAILNEQIQKNESEIELARNEIDSTNIEIRETETRIVETERAIEQQKQRIAGFVNLLFRMDRKQPFEVFLEHSSLSDYVIQQGVAERLQVKVKESKLALDSERKQLALKQDTLQDKKLELVKLTQQLADRNDLLERNRLVRTQVLTDTKNSENTFRAALQDLKAEQNFINADIQDLEESIRKKVSEGGLQKLKELGSATLQWPVPNAGITATFHDPDYPFKYIFEHPAIDIRASQGTPIRAPAPGFVARTKDGGKRGYSYLMLVHNDGISTVYGHVSAFNVVEDQFVNQGDIVAFTGGRPGTHGAGPLTTGPHLHFEVRVNGIPDDPLQYLP